ncbi:MAG: restriction endonuclease subunit S [Cyclobacteriaceae bacterium]|nr:restriction endonuclease subunit S [Cyclobacteriaceae bacterium]
MSEWIKYKLSEVADIIGGGTPSTTIDEYWNGNIPWLTPRDLTNYSFKYISKGERSITESGLRNSSARLLPKGSVLLTSRAPIGYLVIAESEVCTNQGFKSFVINESRVDSEFLFYLLKNNVDNIKSVGTGTTFAEVSGTTLKNLEFLFPEDVIVQKEIASILSSLDDKIELNLQMNQTLEAMAQAIFKEWFVNFNFPGFDGELVDGLPKGWKNSSIGELVSVQNGFAFKSGDFLDVGNNGVIKIKNISNNVVDIVNMQFVSDEVVASVDNRFKVKSGDLLIAMTGAEVGKVGFVPNNEKNLWLNQRVGSFKEKVKFAKWFAYLILSTKEYQNVLLSSASGSAQPNISASQIERVETIIPIHNLVESFGEIVNPLFEKMLENFKQNQNLTEIRDSLLPKLMTGKIRLNHD